MINGSQTTHSSRGNSRNNGSLNTQFAAHFTYGQSGANAADQGVAIRELGNSDALTSIQIIKAVLHLAPALNPVEHLRSTAVGATVKLTSAHPFPSAIYIKYGFFHTYMVI